MVFDSKKPLEKSCSWNSIFSLFFILVLFGGLLTSTQWKVHPEAYRSLAAVEPSSAQSYDYLEMLDLTRQLLSREPVTDFLKEEFKEELQVDEIKMAEFGIDDPRGIEMTETQLLLLLQNNPAIWTDLKKYLNDVPKESPLDDATRQFWKDHFRALFADEGLRSEFRQLNNPTEALHLSTEDGSPAIKNMELFVNHTRNFRGEKLPADDLVKKVVEFIDAAEKELSFNVFDFDHMEIADAFIRAHKRGVSVMGGIDNDVIHEREAVTAVFNKLQSAGLNVQSIDSTGLNHQKLIASDWSLKGRGRALLSSGNFTHSGLDPKGDLHHLPDNIRPAASIPNANHLITLDSDLVSLVIHHQLEKIITYKMRGAEFPISGIYRFYGENKSGKQFPMYLAFTPGGAYKNVNNNLISRVILQGKGPIEMAQFAFSSKEVVDALYQRAVREMRETGSFDFRSVGHAGFAMQFWSGFLAMSGMEKITDGPQKGAFSQEETNPWRNLFSSEFAFNEFRQRLRIGPDAYRDMIWIDAPDGQGTFKKVQVSAKIHHKSLVSGGENSKYEWVISGSFNFSDGAEGNNEQIFVIRDPEFAEEFHGIIDDLYEKSTMSLYDDAKRRNKQVLEKMSEATQ